MNMKGTITSMIATAVTAALLAAPVLASDTNVKVLGDAPAMAMGSIYQSLAHSTAILYENATNAQQQGNISAQAATNQGVIQLYSTDVSDTVLRSMAPGPLTVNKLFAGTPPVKAEQLTVKEQEALSGN